MVGPDVDEMDLLLQSGKDGRKQKKGADFDGRCRLTEYSPTGKMETDYFQGETRGRCGC